MGTSRRKEKGAQQGLTQLSREQARGREVSSIYGCDLGAFSMSCSIQGADFFDRVATLQSPPALGNRGRDVPVCLEIKIKH